MSDQNNVSEQEKKLLLDHDYDGIQEFDYPLPGWWKATFYLGILFGICYIIYYWGFNGPSLKHEYFVDKVEVLQLREAYLEKLKEFNSELYESYKSSPEMVGHGENLFIQNCAACHREKGAGDIGPNLTDAYWLYAEGTPETIYPFILEGNPDNGMPAWAEMLEQDDLYAITAYIMSIQGYPHKDPKEPQGEKYEVE